MDSISKPLKIYCDNTLVVHFSNDDTSSSAARHFQIKYIAIKENVWDHLVSIEQICTRLMIADHFTKALLAEGSNDHVREMGLLVYLNIFD